MSNLLLDERYVQFAGVRLAGFKAGQRSKYACRCPLCGDSQSDKKKLSGNFFTYQNRFVYHCYKCGKSMAIGPFLKRVYPDLYEEYTFNFVTRKPEVPDIPNPIFQEKKVALHINSSEFNIPRISELPPEHPAVSYIARRKIPAKYYSDLFYAEAFQAWSNTVVPGAFENVKYDEPRLVIPFRDSSGKVFAFQGRSFGASKVKYLTVKIDPDAKKIYGLDKIDTSKKIYIVEGPIDSMFVENSLASADSSLTSGVNVNWDVTFVWDNEPRSPQIIKKIESAIDQNLSVVIWRRTNRFKDINDAVQKHGFTIDSINSLIRERTFSGLQARLELNNWRKR